jgi:F0F1-type ATP synthase assembly protein I
MESVKLKYVDSKGELKQLRKPVKQKKYTSGFPMLHTDFGIYILIPVFICSYIGYAIDTIFHTNSTFTLIGIVAGGILAVCNLYILLTKKDGSDRSTH